MDYENAAAGILEALGGAGNVLRVSTCLTRLRLVLADPAKADLDAIRAIKGVLGSVARGSDGLEVILGSTVVEGIAREFALQSGLALDNLGGSCANPLLALSPSKGGAGQEEAEQGGSATAVAPAAAATSAAPGAPAVRIQIPAGRKRSYRAQQQAAIDDERLSKDDIEALKGFLSSEDPDSGRARMRLTGSQSAIGKSVLVINGPNINMLGLREPDIYGRQDYAALLRTCKDAARKAGFADIKCFQSNHEGAIVDEVQAALNSFDGIVMNPGAYTHTSIAILDALKAVQLPCVEVHISKVEEREGFRQVSYVRAACFETITGMGIEGYRKAIFDLAAHLGM